MLVTPALILDFTDPAIGACAFPLRSGDQQIVSMDRQMRWDTSPLE